MGRSVEFCFVVLWVTGQDFVMRYVPWRGFGDSLRAIVPNQFTLRRTTPLFLSACQNFLEKVRIKSEHI
jgi:hypothetical protein